MKEEASLRSTHLADVAHAPPLLLLVRHACHAAPAQRLTDEHVEALEDDADAVRGLAWRGPPQQALFLPIPGVNIGRVFLPLAFGVLHPPELDNVGSVDCAEALEGPLCSLDDGVVFCLRYIVETFVVWFWALVFFGVSDSV